MPELTCLTIGHSGHSMDEFVALLRERGVEVVVDVRSRPYSKYHRHFSYDAIRENLTNRGLRYLFLGKELGGKPESEEFYDCAGHVNYDRLRASGPFREGLQRLLTGLSEYRVALMCAEEDPSHCHRQHLIAPALEEAGITVLHLRGDGSAQTSIELRKSLAPPQPSLFE